MMSDQFPFYPEVMLPKYCPGKFGRWTMATTYGAMPGYYTPAIVSSDIMPVLKRREYGKDIVWMSLTQMEQESHMPHIAAAKGHVMVMGLGMGMYLYNIAQKPEVTHITVIERDISVPVVLEKFSNYNEWVGKEKIEIIIADALKWKTGESVDFLYADFWKNMGDSNMTKYMRTVRENVPNVELYGYWTQEFNYVEYLIKNNISSMKTEPEYYNQWVNSCGMPLVGYNSDVYHYYAVLAPAIQAMAKLIMDNDHYTLSLILKAVGQLINKICYRVNKTKSELVSV